MMTDQDNEWEFAVGECSYCHRSWVKAVSLDADDELLHVCLSPMCSRLGADSLLWDLNITFSCPPNEYVCTRDHSDLPDLVYLED